jgi:hypothetical protein
MAHTPAPRAKSRPWKFSLLLSSVGAACLAVASAAGCSAGERKAVRLPVRPPALGASADVKQPPRLEIPDPPGPLSPHRGDPPPAVEPASIGRSNPQLLHRVTTPLVGIEPPPAPNEPGPPAGPKKDEGIDRILELHRKALKKYEGIHDYTVRFRRREFANGKRQPEDLMELKFKKPFMVHFKFLTDSSSEGREILFVKTGGNDKMHVKLGKGDLVPGMLVQEDPLSERATANSRRTIHDAGIGNLIDRFGRIVADQESGGQTYGTLKYGGQKNRPESIVPMEYVVQQLPPGAEKLLPKGGIRHWYFNADPKAQEFELPVLIITWDESNREVEYYCYDRLQINLNMKAAEFDPLVAFKKK